MVYLDISLKSAYGDSLLLLESLCAIWKIRTIKTNTRSDKCKISMNWKTFKRFFHKNPIEGMTPKIPSQITSFIRAVKVYDVKVVDV